MGKNIWPLCLGIDSCIGCTLRQSSDEVQHGSGENWTGVMRRGAGNQAVCVFQNVGAECGADDRWEAGKTKVVGPGKGEY